MDGCLICFFHSCPAAALLAYMLSGGGGGGLVSLDSRVGDKVG